MNFGVSLSTVSLKKCEVQLGFDWNGLIICTELHFAYPFVSVGCGYRRRGGGLHSEKGRTFLAQEGNFEQERSSTYLFQHKKLLYFIKRKKKKYITVASRNKPINLKFYFDLHTTVVLCTVGITLTCS